MLPWQYNAAEVCDSDTSWVQYLHLICLMIEIFYMRFKAGDISYRQIPIPGGYVIDFQFMLQINIENPLKQRKVYRPNRTVRRSRPGDSTRFVDSAAFMKPTLSQGVYAWLAY